MAPRTSWSRSPDRREQSPASGSHSYDGHTESRRRQAEDDDYYRPGGSRSRSRSPRRSASRSRSRSYRRRSEDYRETGDVNLAAFERPTQLHYKPKLILRGHKRGVSSVKFSPDGKKIASCSADGTIKIWDAETGKHIHTLEGHLAGISTIAWSADSKLIASGSDDKTIRLWDAESGKAHSRRRAIC
jgi:COMPASS component SWD3